MNKFLFPLFFAADGDVAPIHAADDGSDDLKFLKSDDNADDKDDDSDDKEDESDDKDKDDDKDEDKEDDKDDDDGEDKEDDKSDEDEEDEDEKEDSDDDSDEDEESKEGDDDGKVNLVTIKDIKKDFPDFFKKHPEMRSVIFRERQFSEIFADPKQAQESVAKADLFDNIEADLIGGEIKPLLESIKNVKSAKFDNLVKNFLPALRAIDETAYTKLLAVPLKRALRGAKAHALKNGNKNLANAVDHVNQFYFEDETLDTKAEYEDEGAKKTPEQEKYEKKLAELSERDRGTFKNSVDTDWLGEVQTIFMDGLDPDKLLSDWTKTKMLEDCLKEVNKQLSNDPRHMRNMEHLWKNAAAAGYNSESKSRIVTAALARAKQIIPEVRRKLRSEALNERRRRVDKKDNNNKPRKIEASGETHKEKRNLDKGRKDPRSTSQMSELDVLRS
jgi:hypothetical protein